MNKKLLLITITSAFLAIFAILFSSISTNKKFVGDLVFDSVYEDPNNIEEIRFLYPEQPITLYLKDDLWRIKEANDYYTNYLIVKQLIFSFKYSRYVEKVEDIQDIEGIPMQIVSKNGKVLIDITIGQQLPNTNYVFIKLNKSNEIYLISEFLEFPDMLIAWLQQPLAKIDMRDIESITINDQTAKKSSRTRTFSVGEKELNVQPITKIMSYMLFEDVKREEDIELKDFPNRKTFVFTTFEGLITEITLLYGNKGFWAKKKISSTKLTIKEVNDYIDNNSFLYDGWIFKLPPLMGDILSIYNIEN